MCISLIHKLIFKGEIQNQIVQIQKVYDLYSITYALNYINKAFD